MSQIANARLHFGTLSRSAPSQRVPGAMGSAHDRAAGGVAHDSESEDVAQALANLVGCERATLGSSTLHLFWDLFGMLDRRNAIYMDAGVYPIGRWGVERAAARRIPVQVFSHYDGEALRRALQRSARQRLRPVVVADGFCPGCGQPAPIAAYFKSFSREAGCSCWTIPRHSESLAIRHASETPLGSGGGGSLR